MTSLSAADRVALRDLVNRYAARVDDRDPAGVAALFTTDGVLTTAAPPASLGPVDENRGQPAIEQAMAGLESLVGTFHAVTGEVFDPGPDADSAIGRVACIAHHVNERGGELRDVAWAITYRDTYRRNGSGWLFATRSAHLTYLAASPVKLARDTRDAT
ncbi:nuclear transport factor 2 family protein [Nocardioides sp. JQ2195]|uniref:nuclear transport factor 2 family protein n=1 Tax=Nocardioides sp. JQ2195 TaxID=2592334 RepID=UPI00143E683D|nr:nuclear transport factor 2 family protein [Nocardioides sp. JQ2195]QIX25605.1 nuclear transport factor 2 family protein [Nocardioides sp. JQ2195]